MRIDHVTTGPTPRRRTPQRVATAWLGLVLPLALLAACSDASGGSGEGPAESGQTVPEGADEGTGAAQEEAQEEAQEPREVAARSPRLAITYDGGIQVLDAGTLEVVQDIELEGFNRLNAAGDERHAFVSTTGGFTVLDLGTWAEPHGDHAHYYTAAPDLTDTQFSAQTPGHVVVHEGRTALFDDATGEVSIFDSGDLLESDAEVRDHTTPEAHHGVAVELSDGSLVVSEGNEDARTGIRVLDSSDTEIAASDECPGVHGEAVGADEAVVIGCEDGALIYTDGQIAKVSSPDDYGRIGNQAGTEVSPIVLGDYKTDPDAELEEPTQVALIDTRTGDLELVDLPASYTFRSLARGDDGEALVLGTDGQLHVIDPEDGELVDSIPVLQEWSEPVDWQEPRPAVFTLDGSVYITDPASSTIYAVDVPTGEVWNEAELDVVPNEVTGVSGGVVEGVSEDFEGDHDHDEGDHDHDHDH